MNRRGTVFALMLGNFIIGSAVLAPAGMLQELAIQFDIGLSTAGLLISLGAVVLCISSPLMTWLTSAIDRRTLLVATILVVSGAQAVAALSPFWEFLLAVRQLTMAIAAIYTPQAASTVALVVDARHRPAAIATAFLGWSLALAIGVPLMSMLAATFGWRQAYFALAVLAAGTAVMLAVGVPRRLVGVPVSLASWAAIGVPCLQRASGGVADLRGGHLHRHLVGQLSAAQPDADELRNAAAPV